MSRTGFAHIKIRTLAPYMVCRVLRDCGSQGPCWRHWRQKSACCWKTWQSTADHGEAKHHDNVTATAQTSMLTQNVGQKEGRRGGWKMGRMSSKIRHISSLQACQLGPSVQVRGQNGNGHLSKEHTETWRIFFHRNGIYRAKSQWLQCRCGLPEARNLRRKRWQCMLPALALPFLCNGAFCTGYICVPEKIHLYNLSIPSAVTLMSSTWSDYIWLLFDGVCSPSKTTEISPNNQQF